MGLKKEEESFGRIFDMQIYQHYKKEKLAERHLPHKPVRTRLKHTNLIGSAQIDRFDVR